MTGASTTAGFPSGFPSPDFLSVMVYAWGNNARRAELKGRRCVILARGAMSSVLVEFLDTGDRVVTSRRALRRAPAV